MKSWAAIAAGPGGPDRGKHINSPPDADHKERAQHAASGPQDVLLAEALKSRPSVTGERRCLACGRAFRDLQRFAQHIKDAHGGVNAVEAPSNPASTFRPGASAGGAPRPSLRAAVQLGDVLLRSMPLPGAGSRASGKRQLKRQPPQAQQVRQAAQHVSAGGKAAAAAATPSGSLGSRAAAPVLAPPPGTRQRKQNKRESRLKRAFRRSQAVLACERWQGVLAEVEAALQGVTEAQGCLANQQASVARQLAEAAAPPAAAIDWASPQEALGLEEGRQLARANLAVLKQLLEQQQRHAAECRQRLERAHEHARAQLASAQQLLLKHERVAAPEPADTGAATNGADSSPAQPANLPAAAGGWEAQAAPSDAPMEAALLVRSPALQQPPAVGQAGAEQVWACSSGGHAGSVLPPLTTGGPGLAAEQWAQRTSAQTSNSGAAGAGVVEPEAEAVSMDSEGMGDDASEAASSSLASFGFQDVLSGWAASNRHVAALPRKATGPARAAHSTSAQPPGSAAGGSAKGHAAALAASPATAAQPNQQVGPAAAATHGRVAAPAALAVPAQPAGAALPADAAVSPSSRSDAASDAGSESGSSSDGSFGLQWGDQLLAWATNVRADAAAVAKLATGAQPGQRPPAPAQQSQQQQPPLPGPQQAAPMGAVARQETAAPVAPAAAAHASCISAGQSAPSLASKSTQADAPPAASLTIRQEQQQDHHHQQQQQQQSERQQSAAVASQQPPAAAGVDVSAWLSSASDPAPPTDAADACALLPPSTAACSDAASLLDSTVAASAGAGGSATALQDTASEQRREGGQQLPSFVQPAEGIVGAFRCLLCQVTASGQRNLQEHLASKRHVRRVAAQAAAAAQAAEGPEAAQALALASGAGVAGAAAGGSGGAGAAGGGPGRTYTGVGADVEPYVNQVITPELNALAEALLRRLLEWQERARLADPVNFKRKRRLVSGMREVEKAIKTRRAKLVLLAPNISQLVAEPTPIAGATDGGDGGGPDDGSDAPGGAASATCPADVLIALAAEKDVPLVFALSRQRMGKVMGQRKRASAFAVLDANGVFEELRKLLALAEEGRREWAAARTASAAGGQTSGLR